MNLKGSSTGMVILHFRCFFIYLPTVLFLDHATYMSFTSVFLGDAGVKDVSSVMSIGQISEVIFMLLIPFFIAN